MIVGGAHGRLTAVAGVVIGGVGVGVLVLHLVVAEAAAAAANRDYVIAISHIAGIS